MAAEGHRGEPARPRAGLARPAQLLPPAYDVIAYGMLTDASIVGAGYPMARPVAPAPPTPPGPPPARSATVRFSNGTLATGPLPATIT